MKILFVNGWNVFYPELVEKVESFVTLWWSLEDNATYSNADFSGVITEQTEEFEEITLGEEKKIKGLQYLISCRLFKIRNEVYTTLLCY